MTFLGRRRRRSPTGGGNNLIRLLPCTALPVVCLVLFDLIPSPSSTGAVLCGWRYLPTLVGNMIATGATANDEQRRAGEDDAITRPTTTERRRAAQDQSHEPPVLARRSPSLPASYNGRNSLFLFSLSEPVFPDFAIDRSTKEIYGADNLEYYGPFRDVRAKLDYNYHGNYLKSRQQFQDRIVEKFFSGTTIRDSVHGHDCKTALSPWIVFTAGVMVSIARCALPSSYLFRSNVQPFASTNRVLESLTPCSSWRPGACFRWHRTSSQTRTRYAPTSQ